MAIGLATGIGLGISAIGTALSARGQLRAGAAAREAGELEAWRLQYNARIAELQAADAVERGAEAESRFRTSVRGLIGRQRAAFAASGVNLSSGSPADVQADAAELGELDALTIRSNAAREAWGYGVQATDYRLQAEAARRTGRSAQTAGRIGAATTILGTGASLLLSRYGWETSTRTRNV